MLKALFPIFSTGPGAILTLITCPDDWSSPQLGVLRILFIWQLMMMVVNSQQIKFYLISNGTFIGF